jgi:hypothetical protein
MVHDRFGYEMPAPAERMRRFLQPDAAQARAWQLREGTA